MEGRLLETILKAERGVAFRGLRLVTARLERQKRVYARRDALWGPRPPGTTTWLRGTRCTDPEEMPEMEARPPAQNRHGGAPRGERPDGAKGRATSRRAWITTVRLSALRHPLIGVANRKKRMASSK